VCVFFFFFLIKKKKKKKKNKKKKIVFLTKKKKKKKKKKKLRQEDYEFQPGLCSLTGHCGENRGGGWGVGVGRREADYSIAFRNGGVLSYQSIS
jgi:hypothetical protein